MQKSVSENAQNAAQGRKIQGFSGGDPPTITYDSRSNFIFCRQQPSVISPHSV
jgi:hypothetical protein